MIPKEYTPEHISHLAPNEIFVFGSNLQGFHGGGAARFAYEHFDAEWGVGVGMTGRCYAIPTMHGGIDEIKPFVDEFIGFARNHPQYKFLVTPIGCGIAGFTAQQIAPLFIESIPCTNITLPKEFCDILLNYNGFAQTYIPRCPYCGEPIRKSIPNVNWPIIGSLNGGAYDHRVPWNYQWNGVCENCKHDFNINIVVDLYNEGIWRRTTLKVFGKSVPTRFLDACVGFSGVEIEQTTGEGTTKMFVTTNELRSLINAMKDSPILEQIDWSEDYT